MSKKQFLKVTGFIGTLAAGTALVASAATGTGAWFTDSEPGSFSANTGSLDVSLISGHRDMNFQHLMPGAYQHDSVKYQVHQSSGKADVWLVFDPTNPDVAAFTGAKIDGKGGGLGRYGHFAVEDGSGKVLFQSFNLSYAPEGVAGPNCYVNPATGNGGSDAKATSATDAPPYCGVPYAIKLSSGLDSGDTGQVTIEFGVTGRWANVDENKVVVNGAHMNETLPTVPFKIVATQADHRPDAPNF